MLYSRQACEQELPTVYGLPLIHVQYTNSNVPAYLDIPLLRFCRSGFYCGKEDFAHSLALLPPRPPALLHC